MTSMARNGMRIQIRGTDMKIRPPPGGASAIKSLMFVLQGRAVWVPMRLGRHTGGVYGLFGCTKQSRRRPRRRLLLIFISSG